MSLYVASTIRRYVDEMNQRGLEDPVLDEAARDAAAAVDRNGDCPYSTLIRLLEHLGRTGPADLGMRCGSARRLAELGVVGHAIASSRTLGAALQIALAYGTESDPLHEIRYQTRGEDWIIEHRAAPGLSIGARRLVTEEWITTFFAYLAEVTDVRRPPARIELDYAQLRDVDYVRWLPAMPNFGMRRCRVVLPASLLDRQLVSYDHDMLQIILRHFEARPVRHNSATERLVRHLVLNDGIQPTLAGAAADLGTSTRTLVRRLAEEGTTFSRTLDDYRRSYALALARDTRMGLKQISAALGYRSEQSFKRAFVQWTGQPLGRWRRTMSSSDG